MELFIIVATSADGFIAKNKEHLSVTWTNKEDKKRFVELSKDAGVVIMGSNTFKTMPKPLKDRLNVVYSKSMTEKDLPPAEVDRPVLITSKTPAELVTELEAKGYTKAAICGGSEIYSLFLESGLVKKIYLTIEPILFGNGITIFKNQLPESLMMKLEKREVLPGGTLFLDYTIEPTQK